MGGDTEIVLETRELYKAFPGTIATNNVSFDVHRQEIHAIIGENGAGKSTLCKLLTGLYQPDRGDIIFMGNKVCYKTTTEAMAAGINMVYQERNLIPHLTGAQNIMLGNELTKMGVILDEKRIRDTAYQNRDELGIEIPLDIPVGRLSAGVQQSIEIVRAFSTKPKLLILDEPTASLGEREITPFLDFITKIKKSMDISIIFISHKLDEVFQVADRITVFTEGVKVMTAGKEETTREDCICAMLKNGNVEPIKIREKPEDASVILEVGDCTYDGEKHHLGFHVDAGEVVGFYGLVGSGRTECANAIFGISPMDEGSVRLNGELVGDITTHGMIRKGLIMTPEARAHGMFRTYSLIENIEILFLNQFSNRFGIVRDKEAYDFSGSVLEANGVRYSSKEQIISQLSGGNIQKIIIGRSIAVENCSLIILDEPTNGLDLGAKHDVYLKARNLAEEHQKGVIFITSEIDELFSVCNRVYVFAFGNIVEEFTREQFDRQKILEAAFRTSGGNNNGA